MTASHDIPSLISNILTSGQKLNLQPADLAFLATLRYWKDQESQPEFSEEELHIVYEQVDKQLLDSLADSCQRRCNETIRRLLEQNLLICLEGIGEKQHAYLLPPVSEQIVESICTGFDASHTALSTLFMTVASHLREIRDAAVNDGNDQYWRLQIEAPLDVTVRQLVTAIDHRQRQLDQEAIETRSEVVALLKHDWQNAMTRCEHLLNDTQDRLQDLQQLLLASCHHLRQLLEAISSACETADRKLAAHSVFRLEQHLDRIEHWSGERLEHWESFHQRAHQYIRQFINMDERKALMERTLDAIQNYDQTPWSLNLCSDEPLIRLREIDVPQSESVQSQVIMDEEGMTDLDDLEARKSEITHWLKNLVCEKEHLPSYEEALSELSSVIPMTDLLQSAGWLFESMTKLGHFQHPEDIPDSIWQEIMPNLEAEHLQLKLTQPIKQHPTKRQGEPSLEC
ncbi:hypothetical protein [Endozoicomonas arenosclerae]|uniref:hypothetical protein n=1 Tax=Endozoicomonas arenosclerae TaxID=1633495 RepID=UPI0007826E70|nr:hypothetical protein [Endozoicomonas arenosclerae]